MISNFVFVPFFLLIITACTITPPNKSVSDFSPTRSSAGSNTDRCQQLFQQASQSAIKAATASSKIQEVIDMVIHAGETFLNDCVATDQRLAAQPETLQRLRQFSKLIPSTDECGSRYSPATQLMDLNRDGIDELILHTQIVSCNLYARAGFLGEGGLSIAYYFNPQIARWQGISIWPCTGEGCPWLGSIHSPQPIVKPLVTRDEPDHPLMLVEGGYSGVDHDGKILSVWSWQTIPPKIISQIGFSNWCGRSSSFETDKHGQRIFRANWEITQEGYIFIPAAEATERCGAESAKLYILRGDKFIVEEQ